MKKIYLFLLVALMVSVSISAQKVGYLLTESAITSLPYEDGQKPEQNAANWFVSAYGSNAELVQLSDLAALNPATVKVLWINIDRSSFSESQFNDIFTGAVIASIKSYVEAGGNLLLTKQAVRLAYATGRIGYNNNWSDAGYQDGGDIWYLKAKLGGATTNPTDRTNHPIYKNIAMDANGQFPLVGAVRRSDRNNNWSDYLRKDGTGDTHYDNGNVQRLVDFETDWNCEALATWPHINDYCLPMIINFKPNYEDFQGGMLAICLAAYQWGKASYDVTDGPIANVKKLTQNCIEYLYGSDPRPMVEASWNVTPADGVIGGSMVASVTTTGTISWSSSDNTVASVSNEGVIAYNGFGTCTITAVVSKDGYADKNLAQTVTVTGGAAATYAYALPYSLYTMQHYDNEEGFYPDYQAAKWFYDNYVALGTGCFINPTAYSSSAAFPSAIKVLWVNNDHVGLSKEDFYNAFGGDEFKTKLQNFVNEGGNLYLSKQACYLAYKMGKIYDPDSWGNGGYSPSNNDAWCINAGYLGYALDETCRADRSGHAVFRYMNSSPANSFSKENNPERLIPYETFLLVGKTQRSDNNTMWNEMGYNLEKEKLDNNNVTKLSGFESAWNCKVLAVWGHVENFCGAGLVEFLPTGSEGTIICNGFAAYQWGTNNTDPTAISNVQNLTKGVLEYLHNADTYTRTVTNGNYGTICLPRASKSTSGATFYKAIGKILDSSSNPSDVVIEEVAALEAGVPYIFEASADEITVNYTGAAVVTPDNSSSNGLIGSFIQAPIANNSNYYILQENELKRQNGGNNFVGEYRAYFDLGSMKEYNPSSPATAPRKRMGVNAPHVTTGMENVQMDDVRCTKVIENGQLFILRDGAKYNVQGQIIQ